MLHIAPCHFFSGNNTVTHKKAQVAFIEEHWTTFLWDKYRPCLAGTDQAQINETVGMKPLAHLQALSRWLFANIVLLLNAVTMVTRKTNTPRGNFTILLAMDFAL